MQRRRVFVFGDLHFPWCDKRALSAALRRCKEFRPDAIVQIGDIFDMFSFSKFNRSLDYITPREEIELARKLGEDFWGRCKEAAPKAKLHLIFGNHDERPRKKIIEKAPEAEWFFMQSVEDLFDFPGVRSIRDPSEELVIDDVSYFHGHFLKLGDHMRRYHKNCVVGHTHRGGVIVQPWNGRQFFELNAGYLGDKEAVPLRYTQHRAFSDWTLGWGEVDKLGARFVPYVGK